MENKFSAIELKEGKIYKIEGEKKLYKVEDGILEVKFPFNDYFEISYISFNNACKKIFIEVEREIDWTKVPRMTKVQVRDTDYDEWINQYFCGVGEFGFSASSYKDDEYTDYRSYGTNWNYCRIHPSVYIPEEWYK